MIVFDCSNEDTFHHLSYWIEVITTNTGKLPVILLGNKSDLEAKAVTKERAETFAKQAGFAYFETSALLNLNVETAFLHMAKLMLADCHSQPTILECSKSVRLRNSARFLPLKKKKCVCSSSRK